MTVPARPIILIVEDELLVSEDIKKNLLRASDYLIYSVEKGEEAIIKAKEVKPDLILMDIKLKGEMNGIEAANEIRRLYDIPVIYITAYNDPETIKYIKYSSPYGYIQKPFSYKDLTVSVELAIYRYSSEKAVRESELRYKNLMNTARDIIFSLNSDGDIVELNQAFEKILGFSKGEWIGKSIFNLVHKEDLRLLLLEYEKIRKGIPTYLREVRFYNSEGFFITLECSFSAEIREGLAAGVLVLARDITQKKVSQELITIQGEILKKIFDSIPIMITFFDSEGKFQLANKEWERVTGYRFKDINDYDSLLNRFYPDAQTYKKVVKFIESAEERWEEFTLINSRGAKVETLWTNIRFSDGTSMGMGQDITQRKSAEAEIKYQASLLNQVNNSVIATDLNSIVVYWNRYAEKLYQWTSEEALGRHIKELIIIPELEYKEDAMIRKIKTSDHFEGELTAKRKDGSIITVHLNNSIIKNAKGEKIGLVGSSFDLTEQKKAAEALNESREKFRTVVNNLPVIVFSTDNKGIVNVAEGRGLELVNIKPEGILGESIIKVTEDFGVELDTDQKISRTDLLKSVLEGSSYNGTFNIGNKYFEYMLVPFRNSAGEIIGCNGIALDVSDRKRTEEELFQSEERYRKLIESSPDIIGVYSDEKIMFMNKAGKDMLQFPNDDIIGKSVYDIVAPEYHMGLRKRIKLLGEGRELRSGELKLMDYYGRCIDIESIAIPLTYQGKQAIQFIARDIRERKKAEEALRNSEEKFSKVFKASPVAISISTLEEGIFLDVNDSFLEMTGYEREEVLMMRSEDLDIWPGEYSRKRLLTVLDEHKSLSQFEAKFRRKDGEIRESLDWIEPVEISGKKCLIAIIYDITERNTAEKQLKESREQLRELAAKMESIREEERSYIAREVHDELGQMLTALKMDISVMSKKVLSKCKEDEHVEIKEEVASINNLIDTSIHTVRKISSELRSGVLEDLGIIEALEYYARVFEARAEIKCSFIYETEELEVSKSASAVLYKIYQEALTNVARHSGAGEVIIILREGEKGLELSIKDNGKGISGDEISNRKSLGILGMKERALVLGGNVIIRGETNRGTEVLVTIPYSEEVKRYKPKAYEN